MSISAHEHFRPLALYEGMYTSEPRTFAIPATTDPAQWNVWRAAFRARLRERLGGIPTERTPIKVSTAPPTVHAGYQRMYLELESAPGVTVPAWLLTPTGLTGPVPGVIAVHGHGYGVDDTVGINADGTERAEPEGYHQDFAVGLCRRGMADPTPTL